jgi:conjugal transfer ATP-binding protein TraC
LADGILTSDRQHAVATARSHSIHSRRADGRGLRLGATRVQTVSVKRHTDRVRFGLATRFLSDPASGTRGVRHNVLLSLNLHFPDPESTRERPTA